MNYGAVLAVVKIECSDFYRNLKQLPEPLALALASESKSWLSHSFYWCVRGSWIISELVGFGTDTELPPERCLLSCLHYPPPCRYKPFLSAAGRCHRGKLNLWLFSSQASNDGWLAWLLDMMPTHHSYSRSVGTGCGYAALNARAGFHLPFSSVMGGVLSGFNLMLGIKLTDIARDMQPKVYSHRACLHLECVR